LLHGATTAGPPPPAGAPPPPPATPLPSTSSGGRTQSPPTTARANALAPSAAGSSRPPKAAKLNPKALEYEMRYCEESGKCVLDVAASLTLARSALVVDLEKQTVELRVRVTCLSIGSEGRVIHSYDPMSRFAREGECTRTTGALALGGALQLDAECYLAQPAGGERYVDGGQQLLRFKHQTLVENGWLTQGAMWLQLAVQVRPPLARALGARPAASGGDFDSPVRVRPTPRADGAENEEPNYVPSLHPGRAERTVIRRPCDDLVSHPAYLDMSAEALAALGAEHAAPAAIAVAV
jgi:hypothetical protein